MKLLEDNTEENLGDLGLGNKFLIQHQKHNPWKKKIQWDFLKTKNFCSAKDTIKRMKRPSIDREKILLKHLSEGRWSGTLVKSWFRMPEGPGTNPTYKGQ